MGSSAIETVETAVTDAVGRIRDAAPTVDEAVSRLRDAAPSVDLTAGKDALEKARSKAPNRAVVAVVAMGAAVTALLWWLRQR